MTPPRSPVRIPVINLSRHRAILVARSDLEKLTVALNIGDYVLDSFDFFCVLVGYLHFVLLL